jgi:hypothetical protein
VVLADGTLLRTGGDFFRPFGPDLTALFAADAGALGIKTKVVLQLVRDGEAFAYGSYAFDTAEAILAAMSGVAREGLAAECFGFDPFLQAQRMRRDSLPRTPGAWPTWCLAKGSLLKGIREGAKVVAAGRSFLADAAFLDACICEGRSEAAVAADKAAIDRIVSAAGGREVENSHPQDPARQPVPAGQFDGRAGRASGGCRSTPSCRTAAFPRAGRASRTDCGGSRRDRAPRRRHRRHAGGGQPLRLPDRAGLLLARRAGGLHRRSVEPAHLSRLKRFAPNPQARALVERLRAAMIDIFAELGATHLQVGRTYPLERSHDPLHGTCSRR